MSNHSKYMNVLLSFDHVSSILNTLITCVESQRMATGIAVGLPTIVSESKSIGRLVRDIKHETPKEFQRQMVGVVFESYNKYGYSPATQLIVSDRVQGVIAAHTPEELVKLFDNFNEVQKEYFGINYEVDYSDLEGENNEN